MTTKECNIIKREYAETLAAYKQADADYSQNRKSKKLQLVREFCAAQEQQLFNLCGLLGVELWDDDLQLIPLEQEEDAQCSSIDEKQ